jgi:hypothetical protein
MEMVVILLQVWQQVELVEAVVVLEVQVAAIVQAVMIPLAL